MKISAGKNTKISWRGHLLDSLTVGALTFCIGFIALLVIGLISALIHPVVMMVVEAPKATIWVMLGLLSLSLCASVSYMTSEIRLDKRKQKEG